MDDAIIEEFEGLYLVYNARSPLSGDALIKFMGQYRSALSNCDIDLFRKAAKVWRDGTSKDGKARTRFPYPAELIEVIESMRSKEEPKPLAWASLDQASYDALPLSAKIRHCEILAFEYRKKAGGMYGPGKGEGPIHPEKWAKYIPIAEKCQAEARRLSLMLKEAKQRDDLKDVYKAPALSDVLPFEVSHPSN